MCLAKKKQKKKKKTFSHRLFKFIRTKAPEGPWIVLNNNITKVPLRSIVGFKIG